MTGSARPDDRLRDIRASLGGEGAPHVADAHAGYGHSPNALSRCQTAQTLLAPIRSRDALRPGFETFLLFRHPDEGVGGAPKGDWGVEPVPCPTRWRLRGAGRTFRLKASVTSRRRGTPHLAPF